MRAAAAGLSVAVAMTACAAILPGPEVPAPPEGGPTMSFTIPDGWSRLPGTNALHYLTSGDPVVCDGVVGTCDPSTYVMASGTIDAWVEAHDPSDCAETGTPTWEGGVEERADQTRKASYRLEWTVCYPDGVDAVRIVGELRTADMELREAMLGDLRTFVESLALAGSGVQGK